jgi:(1->4)-alpha-D-glucan 1-alpha-D-glucosylmutase
MMIKNPKASSGVLTPPEVSSTSAPPELVAETPEIHDDSSALVDDILNAITQQKETQRLPTATYRVQLNSRCSFRAIEAAVPYMYKLGISDLYASPFLQSRPGSNHGYDVVDHSAINSEIGTIDELRSLRSVLREHDMGLIADVVPNHMSNDPHLNAWWQDVLENGPSSAYATYFDIDWMPLKPDLANKVLLPVLGDQFGKVLEDGQLAVRYGDGTFWLEYFQQRFPLSPRSYSLILAHRLEDLQQELGEQHPELQELQSILTAIKNLPPRTETNLEKLAERRREKEVIKRRLHALVDTSSPLAAFVVESVLAINGQPGDPRSFDRLDELLQEQAYRLAYWRVAADEINYRRFFDINELVAICTELPQVFEETHRLLFDLLNEGILTGLRIDHPDGLYDPRGYLCQLQEQRFVQLCRQELESRDITRESGGRQDAIIQRLVNVWRAATVVPGSPLSRLLYIVVEKILAHNESLPDNWPVHGTVGYEFLNALNGLFVAPAGERPLSALYTRFTGNEIDFQILAYQCKRLIVKLSMASELTVLGHRLDRISERNRWTRDFTLSSLTRALQEVVASFRIYRTYVEPDQILERDLHYIGSAVARAKRHNPAVSASIFDFVHNILLLRYHDNADDEERRAIQQFAGKFQQLTGPIMAKAVEDTAFYRFNRLISLNEVGGEPAHFGTSVAEFHKLNQSRLPRLAYTLNATSTHDTKRSEDVRARIDVLSEIAPRWRERVQRWSRWHRRLKTDLEGTEAPTRNAEYLLYQTLVGTWLGAVPEGEALTHYIDRIQQHMLKVVREAKVNTSWVSPNEAYEAALARFVSGVFTPDRRHAFLGELDEFARQIADHGRWNSLSQLLLKIGSPGVPDFYQGSETWTLTLVDPDNRHPVDLPGLRQSLDQLLAKMFDALQLPSGTDAAEAWLSPLGNNTSILEAAVGELVQRSESRLVHDLLQSRADGRIKQFVTLLALRARRQFAYLFATGDYLPLSMSGKFAENIVAFVRRHGDQAALIVVPRLSVAVSGFGGPAPVSELWADTAIELPEDFSSGQWHDCFTRKSLSSGSRALLVADVLREFPIALLMRQ